MPQQTQLYDQNIDACFEARIGSHGLDAASFAAALRDTAPALDRLRAAHGDGSLPLLQLPAQRDDLPALQEVADRYRAIFDDVVVLGTGGSSLGGRSLNALADAGWGPPLDSPKLHFMDNVDPASFDALFHAINLRQTGFLVISKSGGTAETMMQFLVCLEALLKAVGPERIGTQMTAVAEPGANPLRRIAERHGIPVLDHDPGVGGRYSVLSLTGMLPALLAGLGAAAVREGAAQVLDATLAAEKPKDSAAAVGAAVGIALARERGAVMSVLMPYLDRLADFALWYRQLWAESLGKGGQGTTPLRAIGTVDQHSQLQLYLDGPADKMFTLVMGPSAGTGGRADPDLADDPKLGYLAGRRMGDLLDACQRATAETLARRGRPVRVMRIAPLDERVMGALMMHFMLETIIAAHLLGVDPFDQPAVEDGKVLARQEMEKIGKGA